MIARLRQSQQRLAALARDGRIEVITPPPSRPGLTEAPQPAWLCTRISLGGDVLTYVRRDFHRLPPAILATHLAAIGAALAETRQLSRALTGLVQVFLAGMSTLALAHGDLLSWAFHDAEPWQLGMALVAWAGGWRILSAVLRRQLLSLAWRAL